MGLRRAFTRGSGLALLAILSSSCNSQGGSSSSASDTTDPSPVPLAVQVAIDTKFPIDGTVHWLGQVGKIKVQPGTIFCRAYGGLSNQAVEEILIALGQMKEFDSIKSMRIFMKRIRGNHLQDDWKDCKNGAIQSSIEFTKNNKNKESGLIISVWQYSSDGNLSFLVGGIKRSFDIGREKTLRDYPAQVGGPIPIIAINDDQEKLNDELAKRIILQNMKK